MQKTQMVSRIGAPSVQSQTTRVLLHVYVCVWGGEHSLSAAGSKKKKRQGARRVPHFHTCAALRSRLSRSAARLAAVAPRASSTCARRASSASLLATLDRAAAASFACCSQARRAMPNACQHDGPASGAAGGFSMGCRQEVAAGGASMTCQHEISAGRASMSCSQAMVLVCVTACGAAAGA